MTDQPLDADEAELMDPATWDVDQAEIHEPSKSARAVVSVAFAGDDFDRVADAARRAGKKTSAFIREAALRMCFDGPTITTSEDVYGRLTMWERTRPD